MAANDLTSGKNKPWLWLIIVLALALTPYLLRAEGRSWLCSCGKFSFWTGKVCSSENSQQFLDPYSLTHVLHGFVFCWLMAWLVPQLIPVLRLWLAIVLEAVWEVFEN